MKTAPRQDATLTVRLPEHLIAIAKHTAHRNSISTSALIRLLIINSQLIGPFIQENKQEKQSWNHDASPIA